MVPCSSSSAACPRRAKPPWRDVARRAGAAALEAEIVCSDTAEHRHRAEHRTVDIPGLALPSWDAIVHRDYEPWHREHIVVDTAGRDVAACVTELHRALSQVQATSLTG